MDVAFADNVNDFVSLQEMKYSLEFENMVSDSKKKSAELVPFRLSSRLLLKKLFIFFN